MSARPLGLQVSGPAAWDKATINCRAVQRAHGTKSPTRCPCPQTSHETNVTGLAQKGIIRPVSLNTFTYLRALSVQCFVLAQKEGRAWMEGREEVVTWGEVSVCVCACDEREKKTQGGRKGTERMKWTKDAPGFHSDSPSPENTTEFVRNGRRCVCVCVCVCPPPRGRQEVLLIVVFFFPFFFGLLFRLFCLCYPSCVLFRLIGDLESRANSRQDILQTPWLQFGQIINSERQAFGQQEWKLESQIAVLSGFLLFLLKCLTEVWIPHKHKRLHWSTRGDTDQKFKPALQTQLCSVWLVLKGQTFPVDGKVKKKVFSVIMLCIYLKFFCVSKFLKCFLL